MSSSSSVPLLEMSGVSKRFGATRALHDVSLAVRPGEVLALIGENGAGKSTLMKILAGAIRPDTGTMRLAGKPFVPSGPHAARQAGVAMIYQELNLAPHLSVEDNVMLGQERHQFGWLSRGQQRTMVREALARLGHADLPLDRIVGQLSLGTQQIVEIARALVMSARVIVLDEPTSSLTLADAERLFAIVAKLWADGLAVVYISHFLEEVRRVCDRYTVLRDGEVAGNGLVREANDAQIVKLMVGRDVDELFPRVPHTPGETILCVEHLSGLKLPRDVSFDLRRGEILGVAGLIGAGRTELLRSLMALDPIRQGRVTINNELPAGSVRGRIRNGLALVSENRKGEGLAQIRSIADNLTYSHLKPYHRWGWLNLHRRDRAVRHWMGQLQIKAQSGDQAVQALSGGNQQKVALARALHQQAEVFLLDEPTRGIDVGAKSEIYRLMGQLAAEGKAIMFVSSYLPELMAVCDRLAVIARGRLVDLRPIENWTEEAVMQAAISTSSDQRD